MRRLRPAYFAVCSLLLCAGQAKAGCGPDGPGMIASVALPPAGLTLSGRIVTLTLAAKDSEAAMRLVAALRDHKRAVLLKLDCVRADRPPGAAWEVYAGLPAGAAPRPDSAFFVGNVALLGDGVGPQSPTGAAFVFPLDRAIAAWTGAAPLTATFVPVSGLERDGTPVPAQVQAPVSVGKASLVLETPP